MQPQMTEAEVTQFELQLAGLGSLLEFGCGGSTLVAARQVRRIVSVDSDPVWLGKVQAEVTREVVEFTPFHADIGPVGEWGLSGRRRQYPRLAALSHADMAGPER